jgi:hypothetical protein
LNKKVLNAIIDAHKEVLSCGFETGNEKVIAIGYESGNEWANEIGTSTNVKWKLPDECKEGVITVHNHPSNNTFSPQDIYTMNIEKRIKLSIVQGHDGTLYALSKNSNLKFSISKNTLDTMLYRMLNDPVNNSLLIYEVFDKFVETVASRVGWIYMKGI